MVLDHEDLDLMNFVDKEKLSAPIKSTADKFQLVPEFLKVRGLVKQHLDSFNYFINVGIKKIVRENSRITSTLDPSIYLWSFKDVYVGEPSILNVGSAEVISPHMCRLADMTYAAPIYVNIEYVHGIHGKTTTTSAKDKVVIGRMPIMLRSCRCVLHGKDEEELARLGECPLDPGGYFVIEGTEKVFLIQEQLSKNRIIIDSDKKGNINASVTSSSETTKSKTVIQIEKEKIYLYLHQFVKKIPIIIVLKAMGMESDQEIVQMVGRDPRFSASLLPSMEASIECISEGVNTRQQALDYLEAKLVGSTSFTTSLWQSRDHRMDHLKRWMICFYPAKLNMKDGRALYILCELLLAHVPVRDDNYRQKCFYVGVMLRRMIEAMLNKDSMDDKDYVGNKRLELSGQLISLLFEDLFKTMTTDTIKKVDAILQKLNQATRFDFSQCLTGEKNHNISFGLERTLSTGNFDIKRFRMQRKGMTQVLTRLSFIGSLGSITKISPQFEKSRKVSGPRSLQPSQWGMLCPCDTPEGESCGLVKNLALMTHVTTDQEEGPLVAMCFKLGVTDLEVSSAEELHTPDSFLVILNGLILGKHRRPHYFANSLRRLRRAGKIGKFVSVFINEKQHCVYVASDGGRVCRPLVIAENGESRVKQHHMKELKDGVRTFDDFIREGLIEYLDVNEENNALIALYESEAMKDVTHIEIEPFTILGVVAGLIPYPHHNQSPRNTYQCAMGKQAMGNIAYNQAIKPDGLFAFTYWCWIR
ncbi:BnaA02g23740D [Brassica napus]|uniref:DNA-directed RNA polymerase n=1 Tax=Brassica napus TaxID=3708 RepID=A0A078GM37_BRANA|nr:BnaA02g23740D [Brassica napus]